MSGTPGSPAMNARWTKSASAWSAGVIRALTSGTSTTAARCWPRHSAHTTTWPSTLTACAASGKLLCLANSPNFAHATLASFNDVTIYRIVSISGAIQPIHDAGSDGAGLCAFLFSDDRAAAQTPARDRRNAQQPEA